MRAYTFANYPRAITTLMLLVFGMASATDLRAGMIINISPGAGLSGNAQALAAFQAAANEWSSRISTNITVNINADLANLGNPSIIGSTNAAIFATNYDTVRNAMAAHASASPDLAILAALPTGAQITTNLPSGFSYDGNIALTQANLKALGFSQITSTDATITFNSQFAFAYTAGQLNGSTVDFQTVAAHEIGHALGFISAVDEVDGTAAHAVSLEPLDLFRFSSLNLPTNVSQFTTNARSLTPGSNDFISDGVTSLRMSTGVAGGDGRQASHWKADELTGINLGIMDPTLANGVSTLVSENDLRALALIGYTITSVPEPGSTVLIVVGLSLSVRFRRKAKASMRGWIPST